MYFTHSTERTWVAAGEFSRGQSDLLCRIQSVLATECPTMAGVTSVYFGFQYEYRDERTPLGHYKVSAHDQPWASSRNDVSNEDGGQVTMRKTYGSLRVYLKKFEQPSKL
ncbi:hypothetical protein DdX_13502 [Ditylenchus destructor]|uniref:Uncharacterized protein n=1 Tax=Ditylenchus destructor TaxID=166010 RepID=A0AAD4R2S7_9BILA|nr:hypothetical protein DdX_13502 [Ditylenchus destructor]